MLVIRLPKWSIVMITPATWSGVTAGSSTQDGTMSVVFGPSSAGATRRRRAPPRSARKCRDRGRSRSAPAA